MLLLSLSCISHPVFLCHKSHLVSQNIPKLLYLHRPGTQAFRFPTNLGVPLFGSDGFQSMSIQIHYNNPKEINGLIDNSGVRVYHTTDTREFEVGVLEIGDPYGNLGDLSVGAGLTVHEFECPGSCSSSAIQEPDSGTSPHAHGRCPDDE
jgi:hypothetical protein